MLQVGDSIEVKGPMGKFVYEGRGRYQINRQPGHAKYMSMIAGGSGITPCYAVLRSILADPEDNTRCALIYANKHEEDIWLRKVSSCSVHGKILPGAYIVGLGQPCVRGGGMQASIFAPCHGGSGKETGDSN